MLSWGQKVFLIGPVPDVTNGHPHWYTFICKECKKSVYLFTTLGSISFGRPGTAPLWY